MKIKLNQQSIAFKISVTELETLLEGTSVRVDSIFPGGHALRFHLSPIMAEELSIFADSNIVEVLCPHTSLEHLAAIHPNKDGITETIQWDDASINITITVDIQK